VDNIFIQKSIVMGIGAMTEDDLDLSDSSKITNSFTSNKFFYIIPFFTFIDSKSTYHLVIQNFSSFI
jgi:hypothetical protein